jgi:galactose-1-phosphate uridylyltransferase
MISARTDVSGGRLWSSNDWAVFRANPPTFVGNYWIYPKRHVLNFEDMTSEEQDSLDELSEVLSFQSEHRHDALMVEHGDLPVDLGGYAKTGMEHGHYGLSLEPKIFFPSGFVSFENAVGTFVFESYGRVIDEVRKTLTSRVVESLEAERWRHVK